MRRIEPWYLLAEAVLRPPIALWFNWRLEGMEHVPREGPVLVAANHVSYFDPLAHAYFLVKAGRSPRFLAKKELYGNSVVRRVLLGAGQIPVERGSGSHAPVDAAKQSLRQGDVVVVYPESTITKRPDLLPMSGKTGIARLALSAGVPILPVAVWGSHRVFGSHGSRSLSFGRPIWVMAGTPLDFSQFEEDQRDPAILRKVTDQVMDDLTHLVEDVRRRYPKRWE